MNHDWYRFDHNPMLMYSAPAGWLAMKYQRGGYGLYVEDSPDVLPIVVAEEWKLLKAIADQRTINASQSGIALSPDNHR